MQETDRRRLWFAVRLLLSVAALGFVLRFVDIGAILEAAGALPLWAGAAAVVLTALNLGVGALRWRALLSAMGARTVPPLGRLTRLYVVAFFYNTWLPGGLGGDAVRGVAAADAFGDGGVSKSVAVVLVERILGLIALLGLLGFTTLLAPVPVASAGALRIAALTGLAAVGALVVGLRLGARYLPAHLPEVVNASALWVAVGWSVVSQVVGALAGHAIVVGLDSDITLSTSLVVIPLALTSSYLPFLVGGTGAREVAFAMLYAPAGMTQAAAVAASLLVYGSQLVVGLLGAFLPAE